MFKKLKQKIEEGGDGGIEKVAFSPRKLPGSVIRSSSQSEEAPAPQTSETTPSIGTVEEQDSTGESRDGDQGITIEETAAPGHSVRGQEQVSNSLVPLLMIINKRGCPSPGPVRASCSQSHHYEVVGQLRGCVRS